MNKALLKDLYKAELLEDGTIKGLSEQIDALVKAEDSKFLFEENKKAQFKGMKPGQSGDGGDYDKVDTSKMTYTELAKSDAVGRNEQAANTLSNQTGSLYARLP